MAEYSAVRTERENIAHEFRAGQPIPEIAYCGEENDLWARVFDKLSGLHEDLACARYRRAARRLPLPTDHVPQLHDVSRRLAALTGFQLVPAPGIVPSRPFYAGFAEGVFNATLYLRPPAALFHSPEPDVIHELIGHTVMLADPEFAELYRCFGGAAARVGADREMEAISRVFWFTMEAGLAVENGRPRAYGAAILSSVAELESFSGVELRDFSVDDIITQNFDDGNCQPTLFVAESVDQMIGDVTEYLAGIH